MKTMEQVNAVQLFNLSNEFIDVVLCNYGCTIVSIMVPDKNGEKKNVVAGLSDPDHYKTEHPYFGSTIGRNANRISYGKLKIDENEYLLPANNELNHLHGGVEGFHRKLWRGHRHQEGITFSDLSRDGEEGYPGNLEV